MATLDQKKAADRKQRVTIRDVAKAAGVSVTTVSDSLSGNGRLPADTRERVTAVARSLGYIVDPRSRHFRRGRTGTIGLYVPDRAGRLEVFMNLAVGAADGAFAHDFALTLIPAWRQADRLASTRVDGLIVSDPTRGDPMLDLLPQLDIPIVTCERDLTPGASYASAVVHGEIRSAVDELLAHLTAQGAARISLINVNTDTAFGLDVHTAYAQWCTAQRRTPHSKEVSFVSTPEEVSHAAGLLLGEDRGIDAILCATDATVGVLYAARRAGRRVPDDLLIASCTDESALRSCTPPITSLDLCTRIQGQVSAEVLVSIIEGNQSPELRTIPTRFIERASTRRLDRGRSPSEESRPAPVG